MISKILVINYVYISDNINLNNKKQQGMEVTLIGDQM